MDLGKATKRDLDTERFQTQCPRCQAHFNMMLSDIVIGNCESGGIYSADVKCPYCGYKDDIFDE